MKVDDRAFGLGVEPVTVLPSKKRSPPSQEGRAATACAATGGGGGAGAAGAHAPTGTSSCGRPGTDAARPDLGTAWRREVALELWIDATRDPSIIWLTGTLDASSAPSLVRAVGDLLADGRAVDLEQFSLRVPDREGARALRCTQELATTTPFDTRGPVGGRPT